VGEVERVADLRDDLADLLEGQRAALRQDLLEVLPLHVLHGDERRAGGLVLADVVDGDDGRMIEDSRGLRLAHEALLELLGLLVVAVLDADGFQRDEAPDERVLGQVDDAHRPFAELTNHLVPAELHLTWISDAARILIYDSPPYLEIPMRGQNL
jgi:hypothetical protein